MQLMQIYENFKYLQIGKPKHEGFFFSTLDLVKYEEIANTTLDLLAEFLESLSDDGMCPEDFDVYLSVGAKATFIW